MTDGNTLIILRYAISHAVKTAITLPSYDFQQIERFRRKTKKSRSQIIQEAVRSWFRRHKLREAEEEYVLGYQKYPEESGEIEAFLKAGLSGWKNNEEW